VQRLKTRAQYEAAMAGGTISRTAHFVLHRAPLDARPASTGPASDRTQALFDVQEAWMGAVVPKRWAKRAVTRNGIKRQIYNVSAAFESRLPLAAHVVRLRAGFGRDEFKSAWSEPLRQAVRAELLLLFERAPA
jgi:ribonuclease P protein component